MKYNDSKTNHNNNNNTNKVSKLRYSKSNIVSTLAIASILSIGIYNIVNGIINDFNANNVSALSYSSSSDVSFTFKPTLSIGLSTDSLTIDNLVPGTTSDSNTVTVTVASNTPYGYVLSAGVGSNESTDPYYNTSDLVHDNSTIPTPTTNKFTSIDTNASLSNLDTDNTWGYSTSTNGGTSWSTYSGLSHTATKPLLDISDPATPSTIDFKIAARSSTTQASGAYNNVITFYAVGKPEPTLYDEIAKMSKGTQTAADLQTTITAPTSRDYREDTSNSGVYKYDATTFGAASDADSSYAIYYYRGILEPTADNGTYGSDGKATTYPNYVRLANNTCWRIVRTTGSGGVKMIYNGTWQGTAESGTCANNKTNAQLTTSTFNSSNNNAVYVGYTYNSTMVGVTSSTSVDTVFGSNSNLTLNNTRSNIKAYIEDTWYANNMTSYTDKLESSAGYCNDRSVYDTTGAALAEVTPQQSVQRIFGARQRNFVNDSGGPSLTCPRGNVDNYSYVANSNGTANELKYPAALITADEAALAGSGRSSGNPTTYNAKSYLRSGSAFWLLSPNYRNSSGSAGGFTLYSDGGITGYAVNFTYGVRPAISLKPGTTVADGEGTATNPWTIDE